MLSTEILGLDALLDNALVRTSAFWLRLLLSVTHIGEMFEVPVLRTLAKRSNPLRSYPVSFALNGRVDALQESLHFLHRDASESARSGSRNQLIGTGTSPPATTLALAEGGCVL